MKWSSSVFIVTLQNFFELISIPDLFVVFRVRNFSGLIIFENSLGFVRIKDHFAFVGIQDLFKNVSYLIAGTNPLSKLVDLNPGVVPGVRDHIHSFSSSFTHNSGPIEQSQDWR